MAVAHVPTAEDEILDMLSRFGHEEERDDRVNDDMRDAQEDFRSFMYRMVPGYTDGEHLAQLRDVLVRVERGELKRVIITMPPRHSKSLHVSENFPAWYIGRNPKRRIIAASHTQGFARKFSKRVREKLQYHLWPFPDVTLSKTSQGVDSWELSGYGADGYSCVGVGGSPAGLGADLIIIDDPIGNQQDADSPVIRQALWEWYNGSIYTRRQPDAAIIVTATRWHEDDLTGRLLEQERNGGEDKWFHLHLPARDHNGKTLWPEFWSDHEYTLAESADPVVWQAQYQGDPRARAGNLLEREWFPYAPYGDRYVAIVQAIDTASKPGISNDWSVIATIGVTLTSFDVLHIWRKRAKFPELLQATKDQALWAKTVWQGVPYHLIIENANVGPALKYSLDEDTNLPAELVNPPPGKDPKLQRVISVSPLAKSRRIRLLRDQPWINHFLSEVTGFPTAMFDDVTDAFTMGVLYASGTGSAAAPVTVTQYNDQGNRDNEAFAEVRQGRKPPSQRSPRVRNERGFT